MASTRVTSALLWVPALTIAVLLAAWDLLGLLQVPNAGARQGSLLAFGAALVALAVGIGLEIPVFRRLGVALLAVTYFAAHAFWLPLDMTAAVGFLVLLLVFVELRVLAQRFRVLVQRNLTPDERTRIRAALARATLRLTAASALAFLLPVFAADLALARMLPLTTIPTALLMAAGLIGVVVLLAILPVREDRSE